MSYPPILMSAPRNLSERDSKEYPLAHAPAPESIRRFSFVAGDLQACFEEANDVGEKVQEVRLVVVEGFSRSWAACDEEAWPLEQ
jgi:F-box and WD-40 domain protein CDC4